MNKYVFCLIIIICLASIYFLFIKDETVADKPKDLITQVKEANLDEFKRMFGKNRDEFDVTIDYINSRMIAKSGTDQNLRDYLKQM